MNFRDFYENVCINEDKVVSTQKLGTYAELLFSAGLVEYLIKNTISANGILNIVNSLNNVKEVKTFQHDNYSVILNVHSNSVILTLVGGAFGSLKPKDKTDVMELINSIVTNVPKLNSMHKVNNFKENAKSLPKDSFNIVVNCTGGQPTNGKIKNDVSLEVVSKVENVKVPKDIEKVLYSLKYDATKIGSPSIFDVIFQFSKLFNLKMTKGLENWSSLPNDVSGKGSQANKWLHEIFFNEPYKTLSNTPGHFLHFLRLYMSEHLKDTFDDKTLIIKHFENDFMNELKVQQKNQPEFSHKIYDFLEKHIFGEDNASLVKIDKNQIHEFDIKKYKEVKSRFLVEFNDKKAPSKLLSFNAVDAKNNSFELFWIDNTYEKSAQMHLGPAILTQG